jgi:hypothetical protein
MSASIIQLERYLTLIIRSEMRSFSEVSILMFFDKRALQALNYVSRLAKAHLQLAYFYYPLPGLILPGLPAERGRIIQGGGW